jgi:hypothetical protein
MCQSETSTFSSGTCLQKSLAAIVEEMVRNEPILGAPQQYLSLSRDNRIDTPAIFFFPSAQALKAS